MRAGSDWRRSVVASLALSLIAVAAGCHSNKAKQAAAPDASSGMRPSLTRASSSDACSNRLYEICEPLLLYYASYHQLPATLEELRAIDPTTPIQLSCPVSGQPYVYNPAGLTLPGQPWRIIVYDAIPVHDGKRWAISITQPAGNEPLVTKVMMVPNAWIAAHETAAPAPTTQAQSQ